TIGYGGLDQMNPERWGRINDKVQSELGYLRDFQIAVYNAEISDEAIAARAASYAGAAWGTFENSRTQQAKDEGITLGRRDCINDKASCDECVALATPEGEFIDIDEIPEIGDATCLSNCRCEISFAGAPALEPYLGE